MSILFINTLLKNIGLYLSLCFCFSKIINYKNNTFSKNMLFIIITLLISFIQCYLQEFQTPKFYRLFIIYFSFSVILGKITNTKFSKSILTTLLAMTISHTLSIISTFILSILTISFVKLDAHTISPILFSVIPILTFIFTFFLFKSKRLKHGIPFLIKQTNNEYFDIILLILNMLILFTYFFIGNFNLLPAKYLIISILFFGIISTIIIQKAFILYQKQKLQTKALKDYEQEIAETKEKLATALEEKEKLVKSNHEFYHRQEALNKKLTDLLAQQKLLTNTEFGEDIGNLADRINNLSNEYIEKTKMLPKLTKTNIVEIDDMFSYLQSECDKNNIEFILKIECDVNYIIDNYISKSQLETLLGDLIRNAIIAVNHSQNKFRSIMTVLGIKDDNYEICVLDSGIDFEINTLINLGLARASTYLDEGGTGIGFITTFETINSCNASLIINEVTNNNYSKALQIKFDSKNEYVIISKRIEEIKQLNKLNRNIILKG